MRYFIFFFQVSLFIYLFPKGISSETNSRDTTAVSLSFSLSIIANRMNKPRRFIHYTKKEKESEEREEPENFRTVGIRYFRGASSFRRTRQAARVVLRKWTGRSGGRKEI